MTKIQTGAERMPHALAHLGFMADQIVCMIHVFFFFQAEDGIRDLTVTGVQTCALPISRWPKNTRARMKATANAVKAVQTLQPRAAKSSATKAVIAPKPTLASAKPSPGEIGRASCRERV